MMVNKAAKIGWIGTGVMGKSMAGYLLKSGLSMDVFNRYVQEFGHILNDPYSVNQQIGPSCLLLSSRRFGN